MKALSLKSLAALLVICLFLPSCKKEEGEGGTSSIKGKVIVHDFDAGFQNAAPSRIYPAYDEKVYIIYGEDGNTYNDDFNTSFDGTYEFKHLQKGKYKLFAYGRDSTNAGTTQILSDLKIPVIINVEITSNGSTVDAPDIIILDNKGQ